MNVIPFSQLSRLVADDLLGDEFPTYVIVGPDGGLGQDDRRWTVVTDEEVEEAVASIDPAALAWFQTYEQTSAGTNFLAVPSRTVAGSVPWRGVKHDGDLDGLVAAVAALVRLGRRSL